jgi:hypothetical protein
MTECTQTEFLFEANFRGGSWLGSTAAISPPTQVRIQPTMAPFVALYPLPTLARAGTALYFSGRRQRTNDR